MGDVLSWVVENWQLIVGTLGTIVMGSSILVKAIAPFTRTKKDDEIAGWLDKVYGWLNKLAINPPLTKK